MINRLADKTVDFSEVNSRKILIYSFAQRMVLGIAAGLLVPIKIVIISNSGNKTSRRIH